MNLRMALACGLLLSSDWALAQNQAQRNMQQQQWQLEQTRRGYQAQQDAYAAQQQQAAPPPPPAGQWVKTWGAIAEGKSKPGYSGSGRVTGALTKEEAESRALGECHLFGGSECAVLVTYYDECVALAYGPEGTGAFAKASSMEMAGVRALSYCSQRNNGADCKIDDIRCSEPRFTRY